jgi:hypothetical protein
MPPATMTAFDMPLQLKVRTEQLVPLSISPRPNRNGFRAKRTTTQHARACRQVLTMPYTMISSSPDLATQALQSILQASSTDVMRWETEGTSPFAFADTQAAFHAALWLSPEANSEPFPLIDSSSVLPSPYEMNANDSSSSTFQSSLSSLCCESPTYLRRCCAIPNQLSDLAKVQPVYPLAGLLDGPES